VTTAAGSALRVTGLRRSLGNKVVLDGIDLDVVEGTTFSLPTWAS
jgi:ABC-2 type transport system ATP-binding protein